MRKFLFGMSVVSLLSGIFFLTFSIFKKLEEEKAMEECGNTPGCMYCLPTWIGNKEVIFNGIGIVLIASAITLFIVFIIKGKKNEAIK